MDVFPFVSNTLLARFRPYRFFARTDICHTQCDIVVKYRYKVARYQAAVTSSKIRLCHGRYMLPGVIKMCFNVKCVDFQIGFVLCAIGIRHHETDSIAVAFY